MATQDSNLCDCIFAYMFVYVLFSRVCVCWSVNLYLHLRRDKPDIGPNTLTQCLFYPNLGLHESTNLKQTWLTGTMEEDDKEMKEEGEKIGRAAGAHDREQELYV